MCVYACPDYLAMHAATSGMTACRRSASMMHMDLGTRFDYLPGSEVLCAGLSCENVMAS